MSDNEEIKQYKMWFKCWNCNNIWWEKIIKKHLIEDSWNGCFELEDFARNFVRKIKCPNCDCDGEVRKKVNK